MRNPRYVLVLVVAMLVVSSAPTIAVAADALIEGGKLCTQQFPVQERAQRIPTHLLAAISTTESGRWHKGLGMAVPWPWTINVEGKGYYFDSKAEAIAQTQSLMARGYRSIDVGCMQVNLKHHAGAFRDLNEAFDPAANVGYAAKFLSRNYADLGDWIKATAAYHSRTEARGRQYLAQIERSWNRIVTKVAQARASQGKAVTQAPTASAEESTSGAAPVVAPKKPTRPIAATHNVKIIRVNDAGNAHSEVMVVHPAPPLDEVKPAPAVAATNDDMLIRPAGSSVRRVALDNDDASTQPSAKPKSVFVN